MEAIEAKWAQVKVSSGTNRRVRPLATYKQWKAHEWKTWLLVWIPILKEHVSSGMVQLLSNFTLGILLLMKDTVTRDEVDHSRDLLLLFCKGTNI